MTHFHPHHRHDDPFVDRLDGWEEPVGVGVRQVLAGAVIVLAVATLAGLALWWPRGEAQLDRSAVDFGHRVNAAVTSAETAPCSFDPAEECKMIEFEITSGSSAGDTGSIEQTTEANTPAANLEEGEGIVVSDAGAGAGEARFQFADVQRSSGLLILAALFAVAVVALGRRRGLLALGGIGLTLAVLLVFVFPALLRGTSPVGVALTGAAVIAFGTLYLAHGVTQRTTVALLGTLSALLLTAGLATASAGLTELSGLASEESLTLLAFAPELDFRGLMLAAVVIGALGVLDDVTITQVSAIWELRRSDPTSGGRQLYAAGIRIGRDHIASTVNTLVLAYTAAALPLLLLFTQSGLSLGQMITSETVAVEVVQTLVGSIGLIAAVPLTTALACWVVTRSADQPEDQGERRPRGPRPRPGGQHAPDGLATRRHDAVVPDWEPPVPDPRTGHMPGTSRGGVPPPGPRTSDGWTSQGPGPSEGWASQGPGTADAWRRQDAAPSETWTAPEPREPGPWEPRPGTATPGWPGEGDGSPETWSSPRPATPRGAGTPGTWPRQPGGPTGTGRLPRVPTGEEPGPPGATSWDAPRGPHDPARVRRPYRRTDPQPTDPPPDEPW